MHVSDVLTASVRRIGLRVFVALGASLIVATAIFVAFRLKETYALERQLAQVESTHRDLVLKCAATQTEITQRFDTIERVLFGDVLPKVDAATAAKPPAMRLEAMMLRNEKELRARVEALERWRLKMVD